MGIKGSDFGLPPFNFKARATFPILCGYLGISKVYPVLNIVPAMATVDAAVKPQVGFVEKAQMIQTASAQRTTKQMIFLSLYIMLGGWVFNFDLGEHGCQPRAVVDSRLTKGQDSVGQFCKCSRTENHLAAALPQVTLRLVTLWRFVLKRPFSRVWYP